MSKHSSTTPATGASISARAPFADITNLRSNTPKNALTSSALPTICEGDEVTLEALAELKPAHIQDSAQGAPFSLFESPLAETTSAATPVEVLPLTPENLALFFGAPTAHTRARLSIEDVTVDLATMRAMYHSSAKPTTNLLDSDDEGERIAVTAMVENYGDEYKGIDGGSATSLEYGPMPGNVALNLSASSSLEYGPMPGNAVLNLSTSSSLEYGPMPGNAVLNLSASSSLEYGPMPGNVALNLSASSSLEYGPMPGAVYLNRSMDSDMSEVSIRYVAFAGLADEAFNTSMNSVMSNVSTRYVAFAGLDSALNDSTDSTLSNVSTRYVLFSEQPVIDTDAGDVSFAVPSVTRGINDNAILTLTPENLARFGAPTSLNNKASVNISVNTSLGYGVLLDFSVPAEYDTDDSAYIVTYVEPLGVSLEYAMASPGDFIPPWNFSDDAGAVRGADVSTEYAFPNRSDFLAGEDEFADLSTQYATPNRSDFADGNESGFLPSEEEDAFADLSTQYATPNRSDFVDASFIADDSPDHGSLEADTLFTDVDGNEIDSIELVAEQGMNPGALSPIASDQPCVMDLPHTLTHTNCEPVFDFLGLSGDLTPIITVE